MNIKFIIFGMCLFTMGQVIRAIRWQILPNDINFHKHRLVLYVSLGSLFNIILPFHIGDIFRAFMLSKKENIRLSFSLASLFVERMTDIFIILIIALVFYLWSGSAALINFWLIVVLIFAICLWSSIRFSPSFRRAIYILTSLWNTLIHNFILDFLWNVVTQFNHARFISVRYVSLTALMWSAYFASYVLFSLGLANITILNAWTIFHGNLLLGSVVSLFKELPLDISLVLMIFLLLPILFVFLYYIIYINAHKLSFSGRFLSRLSATTSLITHGVPIAFSGKHAYDNFLMSHFSGKISPLNKLGVFGFHDCKIYRLFAGGSGAITAVVERDGIFTIRKVAEGDHSKRLSEQFLWLQKYKLTNLPLVNVTKLTNEVEYSYYEMPYDLGAVDMYEWLHTVSNEKAIARMTDIINSLYIHHQQFKTEQKPELLNQYLVDKVSRNIKIIKETVSRLIDINDFKINGEKFFISDWDYLGDLILLSNFIKDTTQTEIHGDCTIENLIARSDEGWMFIDPNPSYIYKTELMDWGKLLQSLHKSYESINKNSVCEIEQNNINFLITRSDLYHQLHNITLDYLLDKFGEVGVREAKLHEIVHYLRLLPYKFVKSEESGMLFFGVTCLIIKDFKEKYIDC